MSTSQPPEDDSFVAVPGLGQVKGFTTSDGVSQFLGIPYGLLKTRWTRPEAITRFECGKHDGTRHGPRCPQPSAADFSQLSVPGFPSSPLVVQDEFKCLHLNIVRPSGCTPASNLPVMVWIHGGGFSIGSNSEIAFDGIPLVKESISLGKPVIYVSINYRLGYLGFFASAKLLVESGGKSVGNYGLWDQRLALEWVQEYIEAFGGNPHAVTIFGESAGAVSVHSHMVAKSPLFHQAIVQSGALGTCSPVTLERLSACQGHDRLAEALGFTENVDLQTMRGTSATEIVEAMKKTFKGRLAAFTLLDDRQMEDGFFPPDTDFLGIQPFCKRIVIGDCENDVTGPPILSSHFSMIANVNRGLLLR
ncbi:Alpha/Beta hydrolase protein [Talaromyces proteolyticus]|uniref:Carboxylic ester hydrolase n=1 Tax=Talaromyces proteolyticus TaxID=1131652 RepID=A0AAD4PWR2_9EURO|nr:Alpha/Beta hydrolase protein [Talaromyces proteolyticus]KAH8695380.1 Alpha/Beta hydrolase protein [Talaromyces proteolyticus]